MLKEPSYRPSSITIIVQDVKSALTLKIATNIATQFEKAGKIMISLFKTYYI